MATMTSTSSTIPAPASQHKHVWVITGPAGCGKTSVAEYLHQTFSLPYLEGDTVSPTSFPRLNNNNTSQDSH